MQCSFWALYNGVVLSMSLYMISSVFMSDLTLLMDLIGI